MAPLPFALAHEHGPTAPRLVEHVIYSVFDIDEGSTVRAKHPPNEPIGGEEGRYSDDYLAEHMLPEGVHTRERDTTFWVLQPDGVRYLDGYDGSHVSHVSPDALAGADGEGAGADGTARDDGTRGAARIRHCLYCLSVVRTRLDKSLRRGADVRALALCSRWPFVGAMHDALSSSLDRCFEPGADVATLAAEFASRLNALPMATLPKPTSVERALMWRGVSARMCGDACVEHTPLLWTHRVQIGGAATPGEEEDDDGKDAKLLQCGDEAKQAKQAKEAKEAKEALSLTVPLWQGADEVALAGVSPVTLVQLFGAESTMLIYSALIARARILFVGYSHNGLTASDVVRSVLSAASLALPLQGTTLRTFAYSTLTDLSFLKVPGFIAGVSECATMWRRTAFLGEKSACDAPRLASVARVHALRRPFLCSCGAAVVLCCCAGMLCCCAAVLLCCCAAALRCARHVCAAVLLCCCAAVLCCGAAVLRCCCAALRTACLYR